MRCSTFETSLLPSFLQFPSSSSSSSAPLLQPPSHLPRPPPPTPPPISVNQSFMKSQGDTASVVLVTIATQLLPGHRVQISLEPSKASVLQRIRTRYERKEIKDWREGWGWKVTHWLLQPALTFNLMILLKVVSIQLNTFVLQINQILLTHTFVM